AAHVDRHVDTGFGRPHRHLPCGHGGALGQVVRNGGGQLRALVLDRRRRGPFVELRDRRQRHHGPGGAADGGAGGGIALPGVGRTAGGGRGGRGRRAGRSLRAQRGPRVGGRHVHVLQVLGAADVAPRRLHPHLVLVDGVVDGRHLA